MKNTIKELAATQTSDVRGSALSSSYQLMPVDFLKSIVDGAKKRFYFKQAAKVLVTARGTKDIVQPLRTVYLGGSGVTFDSTTPTAGGADISQTTLNTMSGVTFTPAPYYSQVAIENYALSVHALNLVEYARDELIYAAGDKVDIAIADAAKAAANQATSLLRGAQIVYGGDARRQSELAAGDVITTDMVAEAKRKLQSTDCWYWPTTAGSEALSAQSKNPWSNSDGQFMLFIAPEQEETFLKDSQFVNAAEYGSGEIVLNGEIGRYLGIKVIVTNNVPNVAAGGAVLDGETGGATTTVAINRCVMCVAGRAFGIAHGLSENPTLQVFQEPNRDETRINLLQRYHAAVIHSDAMVFLDVAKA